MDQKGIQILSSTLNLQIKTLDEMYSDHFVHWIKN